MATQELRPTSPASSARVGTGSAPGFDWAAILLASWLMGGVFLDGWAHTHIPQLETIFTPWHAVLYSGYAANALFLAVVWMRRRNAGQDWRVALPAGYMISLLGAAVFFVGGVLDLTGHELFGIEKSIEALLSPTHLTLALGALLIVTGPLRAAAARKQAAPSLLGLLPATLSLTYTLALILFFTQYAQPFVQSYADKATDDTLRGLGIYAILLQTAAFIGVALYALRRWRLPFGFFTLLIGLSDMLINFMAPAPSTLAVLTVGVITGLLVDGVYLALHLPAAPLPPRLRLSVFCLVAPVIVNAVYIVALASAQGLAWSGYLVAGAITQAGLVGLLLSLLITPASRAALADSAPRGA